MNCFGMDSDPGILCFQHCDKEGKIFCFDLPQCCLFCQQDLATADLRIPPFRIPYPFVRASQHPNSIVIKPTKGDFLHDYTNASDLHIGVTDSSGKVYDYDRTGLRSDMSSNGQKQQWNQCLAISLDRVVGRDICEWQEFWDYTLQAVAGQACWSAGRYEESNYNCYTFVLTFLRMLRHPILSNLAGSKTAFCKRFIVPKTTAAGKYISLYRKLREKGVVLH